MKKFLLLAILSVFTSNIFALSGGSSEEPFEVSFPADAVVLGTLATYFTAEYFISEKYSSAPEWDGKYLNKFDINAFDFPLACAYKKTYDFTSNIFMLADIALPGLFVACDIKNAERWKTVCVIYAESFLLNYAIVNTVKHCVKRNRPYMYFDESELTDDLIENRQTSFPSGHTSAAFCGISFFAILMLDSGYMEYWDWGFPVIIAGYVTASVTAAFRMCSGKHFFTDVLAGAAIGTFSGMIIPILHKRTSKSKDPVISKLHFNGSGLNVHIPL